MFFLQVNFYSYKRLYSLTENKLNFSYSKVRNISLPYLRGLELPKLKEKELITVSLFFYSPFIFLTIKVLR